MKITGQGLNLHDIAARNEQLFAKLDRDGDKKVTKDEMKTAMSERGGAGRPDGGPDPAQIAQHLFGKGDTDGDGKLTKAELTSVLPKHDAADALDALFEDADGDGDGAITQAEFQTSLEKRLERATNYDKSGGIMVSVGESRPLGVA